MLGVPGTGIAPYRIDACGNRHSEPDGVCRNTNRHAHSHVHRRSSAEPQRYQRRTYDNLDANLRHDAYSNEFGSGYRDANSDNRHT